MRDHAVITSQYWVGETGRRFRGHKEAQIVGAYLFSCPASTMIGLYHLAIPTLLHETGLSQKEASKGLVRCQEEAFAFYDPPSETVFLPEMARIQLGAALSPGDKRVKAADRMACQMRKSPFFGDFLELYGVPYHLRDALEIQKQDGASKGLARGLQEISENRVGVGVGGEAGVGQGVGVGEGVGDDGESSCRSYRFDEEDSATAAWMLAKMRELKPDLREPNLDEWANTIRLMLERDKRTHADIRDLFERANNDDFWQNNILSPGKLRKQWDQLDLKLRGAGRMDGFTAKERRGASASQQWLKEKQAQARGDGGQ